MKATLTLKNGTLVSFECHAAELSTVLAGLDNVSKAPKTLSEAGEASNITALLTKKKKYPRKTTPWSDKDITEIGRIVKNNLNLNSGITKYVQKYIRTNGDVRNRTEATLYSITSDIKSYLKTGEDKFASKKIRGILNGAGITPVPMVTSNYLNIEEA